MVGTTTKATSRAVTNNGVSPATQAAILAAAAVAQVLMHLMSLLIHLKTCYVTSRCWGWFGTWGK